jgi:hypothetical protein
VVLADSSTGWRLSADGLSITTLTAAEVKEQLALVRNDTYCVLDATKEDATPVPFLDEVPASIQCFPRPTATSAPVGAME